MSRHRGSRNRPRRRGLTAAPLVVALLAFLLQVVVGAAHSPVVAGDATALGQVLGVDAPVCSQAPFDGKTHDRACGDFCPLCQSASHAALAAPEIGAHVGLRLAAPERLGVEAARDGPVKRTCVFAEARGPPVAV